MNVFKLSTSEVDRIIFNAELQFKRYDDDNVAHDSSELINREQLIVMLQQAYSVGFRDGRD